MLTPRYVNAIAHGIVTAAHSPLKVVGVGSCGRGDATEDSDLDLPVAEREIPDPGAEYVRLRDAIGSVGVELIRRGLRSSARVREQPGVPGGSRAARAV